MNLKIINNNDEEFLIPKYRLAEGSLKRRIGVSERFGKSGSFLAGDRKWKGRSTTLIANIHSKTDQVFIDQYKDLINILDDRFNPYFIVDTDNNRRIEFELDTLNPSGPQGMEKKLNSVRLRIFLPEVAWEDLVETEIVSPSAGTDTGETLDVNNIGQLESYPIITLTPLASNSLFTLFNNTTEDLITIGSNAFVVGTELEIDAINGTLTLDDGTSQTEISTAIADGTGFFSIARGNNEIEYESAFGKVDISIKFRNRYLF